MGRGSSGATNVHYVAYDKWGKFLDGADRQQIYDDEGSVVGYIEDRLEFNSVEDVRPVTKKEVLADIDGWRDDDGYYGNEDVHVYFAYQDGTFVTNEDLDGKKYKKSGLVGVSISTGDYEMVWGGEIDKKTGQFRPWQTWSLDGESGLTNSYSGYKSTLRRKVRVRVTFNNRRPDGRFYQKREVIRQTKWVPNKGMY